MRDNPLFIFPDFRNLFIARVVSAIGDKFFTLSIMWWILGSEGGKIGLSLLMTATFAPVVIFSPVMGALSDRHNKKNLMLLADFLRAFILVVVLLFLIKNELGFNKLLFLVFFLYSFTPLFETATASSLLHLTSDKYLPQATAIDSTSIAISNVIGAMLGGIFIAAIGFKGSIAVNILTYIASFLFVSLIRKNLKSSSEQERESYINDIKNGFLYLKNEKKDILKLLLFFGILNIFVSPILMFIPIIVKFILAEQVKWLAIGETFFAIGVLLGSFLMSFKKTIEGNIKILMLTIFSFSVSFLLTAYSKIPILTSFYLFISGLSISIGNVAIVSYFQSKIDNEYKGRFFSLVNAVVYSIMPLSFILNGFMLEHMEPKIIIILNSVFSLSLAFFGYFKFSSENS